MPTDEPRNESIALVVAGAHLSGQPLNHQLIDAGATFEATARTAPRYRLYALPTDPPKPGLVHCGTQDGDSGAIEVEVWRLDPAAFGRFVDSVPAPLVIGRVELQDGRDHAGFLCEPRALDDAVEITGFGGWRAYLDRE